MKQIGSNSASPAKRSQTFCGSGTGTTIVTGVDPSASSKVKRKAASPEPKCGVEPEPLAAFPFTISWKAKVCPRVKGRIPEPVPRSSANVPVQVANDGANWAQVSEREPTETEEARLEASPKLNPKDSLNEIKPARTGPFVDKSRLLKPFAATSPAEKLPEVLILITNELPTAHPGEPTRVFEMLADATSPYGIGATT